MDYKYTQIPFSITTKDNNTYTSNALIYKKNGIYTLTWDWGNVEIAGKLDSLPVIGTIPEGFRPTNDILFTIIDSGANPYFLRLFQNGNVSLQFMAVKTTGLVFFVGSVVYV